MSVPDGEYDIDLSGLLASVQNAPSAESLAIRYGFIPDSMDQTKPLTLYQNDDVCILEAQLLEKNSKAALKPVPVIFEGVQQRQRLTQTSSSGNNDSYYLAFLALDHGDLQPTVKLRQLGSTIRVSKTRNVEKWQKTIAEWSAASNMDLDIPLALTPELEPAEAHVDNCAQPNSHRLTQNLGVGAGRAAKTVGKVVGKQTQSARASNAKNVTSEHDAKSNPPTKPKANTPKVLVQPPRRRVTSKRPPATPEVKPDIISVSDFEDLESEEEAVPVPVPVKEPQPMQNTEEEPKLVQKLEPVMIPQRRKTAGKAPPRAKAEPVSELESEVDADVVADISMTDDFQDLEDQLEEVLEEEPAKPDQPPPTQLQPQKSLVDRAAYDSSDSDDDSDGAFGAPIVINMEQAAPKRRGSRVNAATSSSKPMSLRELYGEKRNEDFSCSEEE
ncbi:hypothetical protein PUMCH_000901 [Australozyma saopauloensis]|uniref:Transcription elongation factor Eaf N-terminal domain-containing protein n=1 Tax=Australozyma saopauloensis TaxID=291208 RepID=A0AAX4H578_9ASCO|nr:hypothetical protein PUMCH_000901 [[Candida] saopauloensis]